MPTAMVEHRATYSAFEPAFPALPMLKLTDHLEATTKRALDAGIVREVGGQWPARLYSHLLRSPRVDQLFYATVRLMGTPPPSPAVSFKIKRHCLQGWVHMRGTDQARTARTTNPSDATLRAVGNRRQHVAAAQLAAAGASNKRKPAAAEN